MVTRIDINAEVQVPPSTTMWPVAVADLVDLLPDFKPDTVASWRKRRILPPPRWGSKVGPLWDWRLDILPWCLATRRSDRRTIAAEMARTGPPQPIISPVPVSPKNLSQSLDTLSPA